MYGSGLVMISSRHDFPLPIQQKNSRGLSGGTISDDSASLQQSQPTTQFAFGGKGLGESGKGLGKPSRTLSGLGVGKGGLIL